jgi:catechol 2,3-dioxygenase-like lactoylglutathione lyase family enzyme
MASFVGGISTITLFVEDLAATRAFYQAVFGRPLVFEDEVSAVFDFGTSQVNLLRTSEAPEVIEPAPVGAAAAGARAMFTITVADVDVIAAELGRRGVTLLNGPIDRPWGVRTVALADPAGHVWELAAPIT